MFLDDKETKRKTVKHISENIHMFSFKEKFFLRIICIALVFSPQLSKSISNIFIFVTRGKKGIKKKNDFVKAEKLKKAGIDNSNKKAVREFDF